MKDQLNIPNSDFDNKQDSIIAYSDAKKLQLAIPATAIITLKANQTDWKTFWGISQNKKNATQVDRENTNTQKTKNITFLRTFIKQYYYDNPAATDADIMAAGLQPHSSAYSRTGIVSAEIPSIIVTPKAGHVLSFDCRNATGTKAKPKNILFIRIKWHAGINVPGNPTEFTRFKDFSKLPVTLTFAPEDAGKAIAIAGCYVTNKGPEAPFTATISTMIP